MTAPQPSPEDPAPAVRVRTHPGLCVGWGECRRWAPDVYPLDDQGHVAVHRMEVASEHADDAWWGASVCPEHEYARASDVPLTNDESRALDDLWSRNFDHTDRYVMPLKASL